MNTRYPPPQLARSPYCSIAGCDMPALYFPMAVCPEKRPKGQIAQVMKCEIGLSFCYKHKASFNPDNFPKLRAGLRLTAQVQQLQPPDLSQLKIVMVPIIQTISPEDNQEPTGSE